MVPTPARCCLLDLSSRKVTACAVFFHVHGACDLLLGIQASLVGKRDWASVVFGLVDPSDFLAIDFARDVYRAPIADAASGQVITFLYERTGLIALIIRDALVEFSFSAD